MMVGSGTAQPSRASCVCVQCQLVPGPRLELLGCCMLRQSGCGSNPGGQTVGARRTRGGLASPDWLEQETSEETSSLAVLWPSEDTRTCIHTANKPNADGSRWLLREGQGASKGQGSISRQLIIADNEKGDSGLKQGLLFPLNSECWWLEPDCEQ